MTDIVIVDLFDCSFADMCLLYVNSASFEFSPIDLTYRNRFLLHDDSESMGVPGLLVLPQSFKAGIYHLLLNNFTYERKHVLEGKAPLLVQQPNSSGMSDSGLNGIPYADNTANNEDDSFDLFVEDDNKSNVNPSTGIGSTKNDYVFDESSGFMDR
ncbi:hypothetical protein Lser_V15G26183 [Lactuca serriola]